MMPPSSARSLGVVRALGKDRSMLTRHDLNAWQLLEIYCWQFAIFAPCRVIGWVGHAIDNAAFWLMSVTAPPVLRAWFEQFDRDSDRERAALDRVEPR